MISIILPIHNSARYLDECLKSILNQSYTNIEVLLIDSSTDESKSIIDKYVSKDKRFKYLYDINNSYGYKINKGIELAKGSYIGIVETDDFIDSNFYLKALEVIQRDKCDFVKYDYYSFCIDSNGKQKKEYILNASENKFYCCFNPQEQTDILYKNGVAIWSGLYSKKFLINNDIKLNESKGASFQDTSFSILTHIYATKITYVREAYYYYREDSNTSSSNNNRSPFAVIDECNYINSIILNDKSISDKQKEAILLKNIRTYNWNYKRLDKKHRTEFLGKIRKEINHYYTSGQYKKMEISLKNQLDEMKYSDLLANKKVSIIIPVYNKEKYIDDALTSCIKQEYKNLEIICVDDGSTDNSFKKLKHYKEIDKRVKLYKQKNQGLSAARNNGIKHVTGDYLLFFDADDLLNTHAIQRLLLVAITNRCDVVEFDADCLFESDDLYSKEKVKYYYHEHEYPISNGKNILTRYVENNEVLDSACLMFFNKRWFIDKNNFKFKKGIIYEDNHIWPILHMKMKNVCLLNEKLYIYRVHWGSIMTTKPSSFNIYSRLKCHMSHMSLINSEKLTKRQKDALIKFDEDVYNTIRWIYTQNSIETVLELGNYKFTKKEINELNKLGIYVNDIKKLKKISSIMSKYSKIKTDNKLNNTIFKWFFEIFKNDNESDKCLMINYGNKCHYNNVSDVITINNKCVCIFERIFKDFYKAK